MMMRSSLGCGLITALLALFVNSEETFEPSVAFLCNLPAMYSMEHGRAWVKDDSTGCLKDPADILNYCRKVFPTLDVRNVVESSQKVTITNWCDFGATICDKQFTVTPFRCLVGAFQSDALLVPEHCVFDHIHDSKLCTSFSEWNKTSQQSCVDRSMVQQSFAMLQPCGIDKFNGVEFVCCPTKHDIELSKEREVLPSNAVQKPVVVAPPVKPTRLVQKRKPVKANVQPSQDVPAVNIGGPQHKWNEHEYYVKAKSDMQKHHHDKITKMMKDWANARQRVQDMKVKDPKGSEKLNREITSRFQKMYEAEEVEGTMEKKQLSMLHQQRVQAELNEKKQRALDVYVEALDDENTDAGEILKSLKRYIKAMQKDRLHTVNHYKHLEETDPADAESSRPKMAEHLRGIDQQLTDAVTMLNRVPRFKSKVLQQIQDYMDSYHSIDRSVALILLSQSTTDKKTVTTTTVAPKSEVAEDDEAYSNEDSDDDDDDEEKDIKDVKGDKKKEGESSDSEKEEQEDEIDDDEDEDDDDDDEGDSNDSDEDSEDEHNYEKPSARPVVMTTAKTPATTKQATTTSATRIETKPRKMKIDVEKQDTSSEETKDSVIAVDYFHLKGGERHHAAANMEKNEFAFNQQAYIQKSPLHSATSRGFSAAVPLGIAVGGLTVFVVIVVGVVLMRRRQRQQRPLRPLGSLDIDAPGVMASPEERHVASMQMNGYENPTYKYFEQNVNA